MVIFPIFQAEIWGSNPVKVQTLGSVSVNHSLTGTMCKYGTSKFGENMNQNVYQPCLFGGGPVPNYLMVMTYTKLGEFPTGKLKV